MLYKNCTNLSKYLNIYHNTYKVLDNYLHFAKVSPVWIEGDLRVCNDHKPRYYPAYISVCQQTHTHHAVSFIKGAQIFNFTP